MGERGGIRKNRTEGRRIRQVMQRGGRWKKMRGRRERRREEDGEVSEGQAVVLLIASPLAGVNIGRRRPPR